MRCKKSYFAVDLSLHPKRTLMSHQHTSTERKLLQACLLNFVITVVEVVGSIASNSLALLSDALHNLGDALSIFLAYIAARVGKRKSNFKQTFGFKRIEIITAFVNALLLTGICLYLFVEAYHRFMNPQPVKGLIMFVIALIGLVANLVAVLILHKHSHTNLNIKSAYLHLLGDTLSSVAVTVGSVFIYFYDIYWLDPVITIVIGIYIIFETIEVLREAFEILMQATPREIDIKNIDSLLKMQISEIDNLHHIHVWKLTDKRIYFECHIDLKSDCPVSQTQPLTERIGEILLAEYGIEHITLQFEFNSCDNKSLVY